MIIEDLVEPELSAKKDTIDDRKDIEPEYLEIKGKVYPVLITEDDTLVLAIIDNVSISSPRKFTNADDRRRYRIYRAYALKVYPYAKEAIRIFREQQYATEHMSRRKRKKYLKNLEKELEQEFETPLSNLTKMQGKIMVKMIEKELEVPMYDLIKGLRGKFKAFYWNQFSKLYGYRLKNVYTEGENPILDIVLQDFDISYEVVDVEQ